MARASVYNNSNNNIIIYACPFAPVGRERNTARSDKTYIM